MPVRGAGSGGGPRKPKRTGRLEYVTTDIRGSPRRRPRAGRRVAVKEHISVAGRMPMMNGSASSRGFLPGKGRTPWSPGWLRGRGDDRSLKRSASELLLRRRQPHRRRNRPGAENPWDRSQGPRAVPPAAALPWSAAAADRGHGPFFRPVTRRDRSDRPRLVLRPGYGQNKPTHGLVPYTRRLPDRETPIDPPGADQTRTVREAALMLACWRAGRTRPAPACSKGAFRRLPPGPDAGVAGTAESRA